MMRSDRIPSQIIAYTDNYKFLTRLTAVFDTRRTTGRGSVFLSQKRLNYHQHPESPSSKSLSSSSPFPDLHCASPLPILVRATDGNDKKDKRVKLSTVVQADDLENFFVKYAECWKSGMTGLKKRDRSGRKAKAKGKKKKGKENEVVKAG